MLLIWELRLLYQQNPLLYLDVSGIAGNAIAHYPGKWGEEVACYQDILGTCNF